MRRKFLVGALSLLILLFVSVISVFIYIRSGRLDLFVQNQIASGLGDLGIRAEIGKTHLDLGGYKVAVENVALYAGQQPAPFASIDSAVVQFSVLDYLKQNIKIDRVVITHPHLSVELDERGNSNLDALHLPPESSQKKGGEVSYSGAVFTLENGQVSFVDRQNGVTAEIPGISADMTGLGQPAPGEEINHSLKLSFDNASATYRDRTISAISALLQATVTDKGAEITQLNLGSDRLGHLAAQGRVTSFEPLKYEAKLHANLVLSELSRIFAPTARMDGGAAFDGQVEGSGPDYHLTGNLSAGSFGVEGFRVSGFAVRTNVQGSGADYHATVNASAGAAADSNVAVDKLRLDTRVKGRALDFDVTGAVALESLKGGRVEVRNLAGQIDARKDRVTLSQLTAAVLGGTISGSASTAFSGGSSRVDVNFNSIDLDQAVALASAKDVKVAGTASGSASLAFPGLNYKAATGRVQASFDAAVSRPGTGSGNASAKGDISVTATGRGFNVDKAVVHSANSDFTASGVVDWDGRALLAVDFKSEDMAEMQRAIDALGLIPEEAKDTYQVALEDTGSFSGRVEGDLGSPSISGHLELASLLSGSESIGSFQGDLAISASLLSVENASVIRPDGSRADFTIKAPLPVNDDISLKARLVNFDMPALVQVASRDLAGFVGAGTINGTLDLEGLPGPRTIRGSGNVSLSAAEFNIPSTEGEEQTKTVSVPEFAGAVSFENNVLSVRDLQMKAGDTSIAGKLTFNLDTYAYSIDAEGKNVDLAKVSEVLPDSVKLTGRTDIAIAGQGDWDDWSTINLNADILGHGVEINGRPLGDAKLTASTQNGLLTLEGAGTLLDQPRTLTATIDLRDRKNYPINSSVEFRDTDIGPYLGLISPQLESVSGRATGAITLSGPLQDTDRIQAVARITKLEFGGKLTEGRNYTLTNKNDIVLTATPAEVTLDPVTMTGEGTSVTVGGTISREAGSRSGLDINGELNLQLISTFTPILYTTGIARVQATIVGSLSAPRLTGSADVKDAGIRVVDFPLSMVHGDGTIRFTADQAAIDNFTASTPGGGSLTISGGAALSDLVPDRWRLEVVANDVGVEYPLDTQTVFDGSLVLQGNRKIQVLSGDVRVRRAAYTKEVPFSELISTGGPFGPQFVETGPGGGGGGGDANPAARFSLDIRISADNAILIRNNLANVTGSAHINLRGPIAAPRAFGQVIFSHGTIQFQDEPYELSRGLLTFPATSGAQPVIDLESTRDISGYQVTIDLSGTFQHLHTTVRSDPPLPENDVIALVLTGRPVSDVGTTAATQQTDLGLAQTLLSAALNEQIQKQTHRLFGISRFSIDPLIAGHGSDPTARVTAGQRITKDFTVSYSQNLTPSGPYGLDRIALIEYRISSRLSVVGIRDDRSGIGFDVRMRKRF